jgi:hypothetical protein
VQFEPEALHASLRRLVALHPEAVYLTHYGAVEQVEKLAGDLHGRIDAMVALAQAAGEQPGRQARLMEALTDLYAEHAAAHGWDGDRAMLRELLGTDIELNAQGLLVWLDRQARH